VFRYDKRRGVWRPANHLLRGFCKTPTELIQEEQKIKTWQSENSDYISNPIKAFELYSQVLRHSLPLIYCGREDLGWSFFDRLYNLPDREIRKSTIREKLRSDRVYRVIQFDIKGRRNASMHRARMSG
jgi:hypothetical protein